MLTGPTAVVPLLPGDDGRWQAVPRSEWGDATDLAASGGSGGVTIRLDATTGGVTSLRLAGPGTASDWASVAHPLGRFTYVAHDGGQGARYHVRGLGRNGLACWLCMLAPARPIRRLCNEREL